MSIDPRDPDASLVALFKDHAMPNAAKSAAAGRPIYDDVEVVEIRFAGSRSVSVFPAAAFSHWAVNPHTGEQIKVSYAERFSRQYQQFKAHAAQTKSGTPLAFAQFLTEGRRAELRALNIYTVEALAAVDGQELKNLGHGGREMKNAAIEYIKAGEAHAPSTQLQAELEALRAVNQTLIDDNDALKQRTLAVASGESQFDDMTTDQIREYVTTHTGHAPQGNLNRKRLLRMAMDARPEKTKAA